MKRLTILTLLAVSALCANSQTFTVLSPGEDYSLYVQGMSNNGKWLCGYYGSASCIINTETGEYIDYLYESDFNSITNDGVMAGWASLDVDDGETSAVLFGPDGYEKIYPNDENTSAMAKAITNDGSIVCGFTYNNSTRVRKACIWKGDEQIFLPDPEDCAFRTSRGCAAQFISDDAKIIVGYIVYGASYPCIVWRLQDDGSYVCDPICNRYFNSDTDSDDQDNEWYQLMPEGLSKNGKYVSLLLVDENGYWRIGRYNTEDDTLTASDDTFDYWPEHVSDQGTIVGWLIYNDEYYVATMWRVEDDNVQIISELHEDQETLYYYDYLGTNRAVCISPSGRYIAGVAVAQFDVSEEYARDFAWWLDLGEDEEGYEEAVEDGIKQVANAQTRKRANAGVYDISGRAVSHPNKGFYIIDGQKLILK